MPLDQPIGFFIFDYAWVLLILITVLNAFILKTRSKKFMKDNPELEEGYDRLFKGYLIYMNIPWVIMGVGMLLGGVPSTFSYLTPARISNPFIIVFHATIVILWILSIWWLYFKDGAEFLVKYKGVFNRDFQSPMVIKVFFGIALIFGVAGMIFMWSW